MPDPVSSTSRASSIDSAPATAAEPPRAPPPAVTTQPVTITGEAGSRRLVAQHDQQMGRRACLPETREVTTSSLALAAATLGTAAAIATGGGALLLASGFVAVFGLSIDAGAKLGDLSECKKR